MAPSSPPGYTHCRTLPRRPGTPGQLLALAVLLIAAPLGTAYEVTLKQPWQYLTGGEPLSTWWAIGSGLAGLSAGAVASARVRQPGRYWCWSVVAASGTTTLSAYALFTAYPRPGWFAITALAVPAGAGVLLAASLVLGLRTLGPRFLAMDLLGQALGPIRLLGTAATLAVATGVLTVLGLLRSAALLGMTLALLALIGSSLAPQLSLAARPVARATRTASLVAFVGGVVAFGASARLVPIGDLRRLHGVILYALTSPRNHYVVTTGQQAFALFANDNAELTTLDGYRYAESIVHPAMSAATRREHVVVLGGGKGLVERELLRYPDVIRITVLVDDATLPALCRRVPWLRRANEHALDDPRVRVLEEEPIVWLDRPGEMIDVAIIDLPDPRSYLEAKNFTQYFFERLRSRLGPDGVAAIQATSPFRSPATFDTVEATARAAGLRVLPYHAPLPTWGEWGFLLASRGPPMLRQSLPVGLTFLDAPTLHDLFVMAPDSPRPAPPARPHRLHDMTLLDVFEGEATGP